MKDRLRHLPWIDIGILFIGSLLALYLRLSLFEYESGDFHLFFQEWITRLQEDGFQAIVTLKYDYTPTYLYLLYAVSRTMPEIPPVTALKIPSLIFDFLSAFLVYRIVRLFYPGSITALFAYFTVLFVPTVVINSALWGQSESIYTAFLLLTVYACLVNRANVAGLAFGVAFAIKLQSIFLLPALFALSIKGRFSWKHYLWIPFVYILLMIPAWIAGRPLSDLLSIYFRQSQEYPSLTLNAPTFYAWFPDSLFNVLYQAAVIWAASMVFLYLLLVYKSKVELSAALITKLCMLSLVLVPFVLPKMHERYFFPADVFSIPFGFIFPGYFFIPIMMSLVSFFTYQPFLFGRQVLPIEILSLAVLVILVLLTRDAIKALFR